MEEGESLDEVMRRIMKCVKSKEGYSFDAENMQVIAKALKEAFCDINMIQIYGLDIEEYLELFFKRYFSKLIKKNEKVAISIFERALNAMRVTSFEKRLGIVFDYFGECPYNDIENIYILFEEKINNIQKKISKKISKEVCSEDRVFERFLEYCKRCYYAYLYEECYYRKKYEDLYYSSMTCWKEECDGKEKVRKLREVKVLDDNIALNAKFISQHLQISRFKNGNPTPIKYERSRDYGMDGDPYRSNMIYSLGEFIDEACKIADEMKGDMILNSKLSPYAFQTKN
ncbi:MAG: hypothetical protein K2P21_10465 [Lachnospiraceae bacterium]|nr:hypothetical protein [Lachnospiraceae bacterium]